MNIGDTIKSAVQGMPTLLTGGHPSYRAGDEKLAWMQIGLMGSADFPVHSDAFADGEPIPFKYGTDGQNVSPPLSWSTPPAKTMSLVVVVEDPDAPTPEPFVHWLVYNIPADAKGLSEGTDKGAMKGVEGENSKLKPGWTGMAPPKGDSPHRYVFQIFALDTGLSLEKEAGRAELFKAMAGHVLGRGILVGTYQRA
ncbi:MAG TPA: YbhB/YbcL family Raf kinase inhibitor-like protein [Tepidisphaeraceae bacterium]|jgi:hypothetical protein|nr:YbhB/YbcL family Raf kinase inhibitor-like protein [Tepidisphaeraceae bacterium]